MKINYKAFSREQKDPTRTILITGIIILLLQLAFHLTVEAKSLASFQQSTQDSIKIELNRQLKDIKVLKKFNFPNTVKRFYKLNSSEMNWLKSDQNIGPTAAAMLLLDCVRQYGLEYATYHPETVNYTRMYDALNKEKPGSVTQKIEFELMLTDAMISIINHLHFGAYNPYLSRATIDNGIPNQLKAEYFLRNAIDSPNLMESILTAQPKSDQYKQLQDYMKLITGQYTCDSYETPVAEVRKIAINMERIRWMRNDQKNYVQINIPSFELFYRSADSIYHFKVVVGKPITPTPTLQSSIHMIETAPDWNVPEKIFIKELLPKALKNNAFFDENHMSVYDTSGNIIAINETALAQIRANPKLYHLRQSAGCDNALGKVVFRFNNNYGIYLHDTPDQSYFKEELRALSHGCIRVENAEKLAVLILTQDHQEKKIETLNAAMNGYIKKKFNLLSPIPISIIYLTCTVRDGMLVSHDDIYRLDEQLEQKIYGSAKQIIKNNHY